MKSEYSKILLPAAGSNADANEDTWIIKQQVILLNKIFSSYKTVHNENVNSTWQHFFCNQAFLDKNQHAHLPPAPQNIPGFLMKTYMLWYAIPFRVSNHTFTSQGHQP
jgi:hypothetical protein